MQSTDIERTIRTPKKNIQASIYAVQTMNVWNQYITIKGSNWKWRHHSRKVTYWYPFTTRCNSGKLRMIYPMAKAHWPFVLGVKCPTFNTTDNISWETKQQKQTKSSKFYSLLICPVSLILYLCLTMSNWGIHVILLVYLLALKYITWCSKCSFS